LCSRHFVSTKTLFLSRNNVETRKPTHFIFCCIICMASYHGISLGDIYHPLWWCDLVRFHVLFKLCQISCQFHQILATGIHLGDSIHWIHSLKSYLIGLVELQAPIYTRLEHRIHLLGEAKITNHSTFVITWSCNVGFLFRLVGFIRWFVVYSAIIIRRLYWWRLVWHWRRKLFYRCCILSKIFNHTLQKLLGQCEAVSEEFVMFMVIMLIIRA